MEYRQAPEVKAIAESLVWDYHEDLADDGPHIEYVMTRSGGSKAPRRMFRIRKITGLHAYLASEAARKPERFAEPQAEPFVVVEVAEFWWGALSADQRKGMVDHILSHLVYDADAGTWSIEPPQYGEFPGVLDRHGFWRPDDSFKDFAQAVSEQLSLLPEEERHRLMVPPEMREAIAKGEMSLEVGLAQGVGPASETAIINGQVVDKETGEVLQESQA